MWSPPPSWRAAIGEDGYAQVPETDANGGASLATGSCAETTVDDGDGAHVCTRVQGAQGSDGSEPPQADFVLEGFKRNECVRTPVTVEWARHGCYGCSTVVLK